MNIYSKTTNSPQVSDTSHYTPELRFPGFKGNWEVKKISDLYERHIEKNNLTFREDSIISVANMYYKKDSTISDETYLKTYNVFRLNDIAFEGNKSASHAYGRFVQNTIGDGIVSHVFEVFRPISSNMYPLFWSYYINYERVMCPILEKSTKKTTMMTNLVAKDFLKQTILVPTLPEQQKIASCLSSLDELIAAEAQKADALKAHKKGLMQQLFPSMSNEQLAMSNCTPKLRFPGFEGEWVVKKLGEIFNRITRKNAEDNKNVLTISAQYGLVSQTDFFNKSVAAADVTGYYLLEKGDFAYNKSSSSGNSVGVIKPLKRYEKGVVSTLYICFNCKEPKSIPFWEQYFNAGCLDSEIRTIAQEGARNHGLLNVPTSDFFTLNVLVPTLAEQQKIADCLSALDEQISAQQQKVDALKEHKKGLMQQLFPSMRNEK